MKHLLLQCAWCRAWIDERSQQIQLPKWIDVSACDVSHGICQKCMIEQLALAETTNQRAQQETA